MIRTGYRKHFLPTVEIKYYNAMIDRQNFFPVKNDPRTYDNTPKIAAIHRDDYTTDCMLDYNYYENCYKVIAIDLNKQQVFGVDLKAMQEINFTENIDIKARKTMQLRTLKNQLRNSQLRKMLL